MLKTHGSVVGLQPLGQSGEGGGRDERVQRLLRRLHGDGDGDFRDGEAVAVRGRHGERLAVQRDLDAGEHGQRVVAARRGQYAVELAEEGLRGGGGHQASPPVTRS